MLEKIISLSEVSLIDFLGVANANISLLINAFPQSKIIARGEQLTVRGSNDQIALVEAIVNSCVAHLDKHHSLTEKHMQAYIDKNQLPIKTIHIADILINEIAKKTK